VSHLISSPSQPNLFHQCPKPFENTVTYTPGARQSLLWKKLYNQPLLGNKSVNNSRCQVVAALCIRNTILSAVHAEKFYIYFIY
jgi:hypothetical protein